MKVKVQIQKNRILTSVCAFLALILVMSIIVAVSVKHEGEVKNAVEFNASEALGTSAETAQGIDVSSHNGSIDWSKVKDEAKFAFVRVGYRGYGTGEINTDEKADENIRGAISNGIPVGVYFYSQAVNQIEAEQEAQFALDAIKKYNVTLPVVIDFEYPYDESGNPSGRLAEMGLSNQERTSIINAFCDVVKKGGYPAAVYASSYIYDSEFNMDDIDDDVTIWAADYNENMTYNISYDLRQYTKTGKCKGISSKHVDLNTWFLDGSTRN